MACVESDCEVGDRRVFGFAGAVRYDCRKARFVRHLYRVHRFGDGADLVQLDEDGVAASVLNAFDEAFGVRDEQVIADELHVFAGGLRPLPQPKI